MKNISFTLILLFAISSHIKHSYSTEDLWIWASSKIEGTTIDGESTEVVTKKDDNTIIIHYYDNKYSTAYTIYSNGRYSIACGVVINPN
tara:strand:+ start:360 stop:626 length:267 start_codon:yes stop_codon:yes gene_type:complete